MQKLGNSWDIMLKEIFEQDYFKKLCLFLDCEYKNKIIYPKRENIFTALEKTSFDDVKVVILGQDPYHGEGQAHGLCFSVPNGIKTPPSLVNIFKEIDSDLGIKNSSPNLNEWSKQGVLLLNTVLTVESGLANSHKNKGWENFTDSIIKLLAEREQPIVFILWGGNARSKKKFIKNAISYDDFIKIKNNKQNVSSHLILECAHPSPLSVYRGFIGCKHFSKTNEFLNYTKCQAIDWRTK